MSAFEFFFTLVSLITSLALVHLISGAVDLIRYRDRKGLSGIHLFWMAGAFFLTLGNWANFWLARNTTGWSAIQVLLAVFGLTILYAFAVLVTPDTRDGGTLDLATFHEREGRRYMAAHGLFAGITIPWILWEQGWNAAVLISRIPPFIGVVVTVIALTWFKNRVVQWAMAILGFLNILLSMWPFLAIST